MTTPDESPVLSVKGLEVAYAMSGGKRIRVVEQVAFDIAKAETLALVGESGCGKSSVARAIMQLQASNGEILLEGRELSAMSKQDLKRARRRFQLIFQDPISSLNPQRKVREILEAPLKVNALYQKQASEKRIHEVLELVGLDASAVLDRYPHEFSGGQCQRLSIARALLLDPVLLVCDEPVSALDVSVRSQVLNVLNELGRRLGLSMLFISHDLAVVRNVADRVAVMYLGRIVEIGDADDIFLHPAHPYTAALLSAVPVADLDALHKRIKLKGEMPSPMALPPGCRFQTRCPVAQNCCAISEPPLEKLSDGRSVACFFPFSLDSANSKKTENMHYNQETIV